MVAAAIACLLGMLACATIVTMYEPNKAVQNYQTDVARHP
jgi:hypothetical protein